MPVHSCGSSAHSWLCVCHRAVHSDWADGSNSDDGGHRRGRPCVPGTGSGRMAGKESLQHRMREKQASFGHEEAANRPVWKPLLGKNGLASPKGDLQICSEVGNSRGRVLVPDCPLPALQRHSQILKLFSMKVKATGVCQTWQAPYWPQHSYYLSIQTRTKATL